MVPLAGYTCSPFQMPGVERGAGLCLYRDIRANALKHSDRAACLLYTTQDESAQQSTFIDIELDTVLNDFRHFVNGFLPLIVAFGFFIDDAYDFTGVTESHRLCRIY